MNYFTFELIPIDVERGLPFLVYTKHAFIDAAFVYLVVSF